MSFPQIHEATSIWARPCATGNQSGSCLVVIVMRSRVLRRVLLPPSLLLLAFPGIAVAGAPNYECRAGSYRMGIDQHRSAGLSRTDRASVQAMPFSESDQNGPSLDLVATIDGRTSQVVVRGTGSSMSLTTGRRHFTGACAFIPGNFALGHVTASRLAIRTRPADDAAAVMFIGKGSLVWSPGRFNETTGRIEGTDAWTRVRVILRVRGRTPAGGEQALGMGDAAGLDGRSQTVEGWSRVEGLSLIGPAGP